MDVQEVAIIPRWRRTAFTAEEELEVVRRIDGGQKMAALARELGVHRNTISNIVRRHRQSEGGRHE